MAGQSRIIGRIASITYSTSLTEDEAEFLVQYRCSGLVSGQFFGEVVLVCDITQAESQINADLRAALAAQVDPLVEPPQAYTASDVRGLNL